MSTLMPIRKPTRMPFFTHALTRQPVADAGSGSAARILPSVSEMRKAAKMALSSGVYCAGLSSKSRSISACMVYQKSNGSEHRLDLAQVGLAGRHHGEAPDGFQQAHQRHRGFHRNGVGLHEIDIHQREESGLEFASGGEIVAQAGLRDGAHFGGR